MKIEMMTSQVALLNRMQEMERIATQPGLPLSGVDTDLSFGHAMRDVVNRVNAQQNLSSRMMTAVDTGQSDDLVGAMVASQKAGLSFSALMQVRNKLMTGFDDIMRMPL
ncbi:flagellar hook-basal body complex protein FliE [Aeromonas schubertii]|uniref:Flagellar hook-basal body complex protein FliE n=1 Tax=Aeromonas schubertii TaxID=652 RepID=A0ABS7VDF4_9GAMM|nr:flagellar hook-basal body complex protein FliE [Aeromonas schubertii]MBZ6067102.1 flagellar hook-basal body complex protein FliE [Aeromonas schubertii]MBZ6074152.1 flagellar hook-basal body complex protein FliE [Aeromonas schubertii]